MLAFDHYFHCNPPAPDDGYVQVASMVLTPIHFDHDGNVYTPTAPASTGREKSAPLNIRVPFPVNRTGVGAANRPNFCYDGYQFLQKNWKAFREAHLSVFGLQYESTRTTRAFLRMLERYKWHPPEEISDPTKWYYFCHHDEPVFGDPVAMATFARYVPDEERLQRLRIVFDVNATVQVASHRLPAFFQYGLTMDQIYTQDQLTRLSQYPHIFAELKRNGNIIHYRGTHGERRYIAIIPYERNTGGAKSALIGEILATLGMTEAPLEFETVDKLEPLDVKPVGTFLQRIMKFGDGVAPDDAMGEHSVVMSMFATNEHRIVPMTSAIQSLAEIADRYGKFIEGIRQGDRIPHPWHLAGIFASVLDRRDAGKLAAAKSEYYNQMHAAVIEHIFLNTPLPIGILCMIESQVRDRWSSKWVNDAGELSDPYWLRDAESILRTWLTSADWAMEGRMANFEEGKVVGAVKIRRDMRGTGPYPVRNLIPKNDHFVWGVIAGALAEHRSQRSLGLPAPTPDDMPI
jgi:hypothetical protein